MLLVGDVLVVEDEDRIFKEGITNCTDPVFAGDRGEVDPLHAGTDVLFQFCDDNGHCYSTFRCPGCIQS